MGTRRLTLFLALGAALAAEDAPDKKPLPGATVTVTAEARAVDVARTPNPVRIVPKEELFSVGTKTLSELLATLLPGQVMSNGGVGTQTSLFLNGARSQDTVVLLDGIRISDAGGLGMDLGQFSLAGVDRVEILTGPASTLHGADAHGGVLSLGSGGAPAEGVSGLARLGLGLDGQARGAFLPAYGWKGGWVRAGWSGERMDQPTATPETFRQSTGFLGLGLNLGDDHLLTLNLRNFYKAVPLPYAWAYDMVTWAPTRSYDDRRASRWRQEVATLGWTATWSPTLASEVHLGSVQGHQAYTDGSFEGHHRRNQATGRLSWATPSLGVSVLTDLSEETFWNRDPGAQITSRHVAQALEVTGEPTDTLRLVGSLRHQADRLGQEGPGGLQDQDFRQTTWKLGANLMLAEGLRAYVSTGTSFNMPSLYSLQWNASLGMALPGNEESRSTLAGLTWERKAWFARLEASRLNYRHVNDWVGDWVTGHYVAQSGLRVQGTELTTGYRGPSWGLEASLRNQEGRLGSLPPDRQLEAFLNRPFTTLGTRAWVKRGSLDLAASLSWVGHRYVYDSDLGGVAPARNHFLDASLQATWHASKAMEFVLKAEHLAQAPLTRRDWEQGHDGGNNVGLLPGYPAPTRTLSLEARYRF
jgi:vitamin B12 transporter